MMLKAGKIHFFCVLILLYYQCITVQTPLLLNNLVVRAMASRLIYLEIKHRQNHLEKNILHLNSREKSTFKRVYIIPLPTMILMRDKSNKTLYRKTVAKN